MDDVGEVAFEDPAGFGAELWADARARGQPRRSAADLADPGSVVVTTGEPVSPLEPLVLAPHYVYELVAQLSAGARQLLRSVDGLPTSFAVGWPHEVPATASALDVSLTL